MGGSVHLKYAEACGVTTMAAQTVRRSDGRAVGPEAHLAIPDLLAPSEIERCRELRGHVRAAFQVVARVAALVRLTG